MAVLSIWEMLLMAAKQNKAIYTVFIGIMIGLVCFVAVIAALRLDTTGKSGSGLGADFEYNLEQLSKIDPNLILYKELATPINTGFAQSHAIAIDKDGLIYVAGDRAIRIFSDKGLRNNELKLPAEPSSLAVEAQKNDIFVGMKDHVEVYNSSGELLSKWNSLGNNAIITAIAIGQDDVFIADAGNRKVYHYNKAGEIINQIGGRNTDKNISGFVIPSPYFDLAIGRDGLLRVVNPGIHNIEAYTFNGNLEFSWGEFSNSNIEGFCGCCNPVNFAILPGRDATGIDDKFITSEKGLTRIKVYDSKGTFVGVVAGPQQLIEGGKVEICDTPEECQIGGFDVAVSPDGRVFVLDTIRNIIRIFSLI
jgi:hypothetical protein